MNMDQTGVFFRNLSSDDFEEIKSLAKEKYFAKGEVVFLEGDEAKSFYIIKEGKVSVYYNDKGNEKNLCTLVNNDYFGEMAIYNHDKRSASVKAIEDTLLLKIKKNVFLKFVDEHLELAEKINNNLQLRNEELFLRESLIDLTGLNSKRLHLSIKGDPSMRESAFVRERYQSVVDKVLDKLQPVFENLLLKRCIYSLFVNFNSGEIRTSSIYNPFVEELHTSDKLINPAYVERHFPEISYQEKSEIIHSIYDFLASNTKLPTQNKNVILKSYENWQPVTENEISEVIVQLTKLRSIQSFYLRNFSISMVVDAIRMQFNCDGTHIVSADDYQRFLQENLEES